MYPQEQQPNLDVYQMKQELEAQVQAYNPSYGDYQSNLTQARTAYGDVPAMLMTGGAYAGASAGGAVRGMGNLISDVGAHIRPATYTPSARVVTGYYGQYQQETGLFRSAVGAMGFMTPPRGVSGYMYGYNNASDLGERVGGLAASAGFMAAGLGVGAPIGSAIGGGIGGLGGAVGAAFSPLTMGAGAVVGSLAGGLAGYAAVDAIADVVAQRRQMNAFLETSSFRYVGAGSSMADPRLGSGMDPRSRRQATDFLHKMDVRDPSMNMDDLFNVLQGSTSLGLFAGTKDIDDFKTKFKEIVDGVKVVSKALHTSLQEGLAVMKDLKSIDITPGQMGKVAFQAEVAGKIAGKTPYEIVNLGLQGAELFRGTGIEMKIGYQANVMNISAVRAARDAGILSQEAINQAGGEEPLAQQMTSRGLQFMQSSWGRGLGGAFFKSGMGPGGFDRGAFMNQMATGKMGLADTFLQMGRNLDEPGKVIEYEAYQDKFMSAMGKTFGGDNQIMLGHAIMQQAQHLVDMKATPDIKAAFRLVAQRDANMSPGEADLLMGTIQGARQSYEGKRKAVRNTAMQRSVDEALSTRGVSYGVAALWDVGKTYLEPAVAMGEDVIEGVKQWGIKTWEEKGVGIYRYNVETSPYEGMGGRTLVAPTAPQELKRFSKVDVSPGAATLKESQMIGDYKKRLRTGAENGDLPPFASTQQAVEYLTQKPIGQVSDDEYRAASLAIKQQAGDRGGRDTYAVEKGPAAGLAGSDISPVGTKVVNALASQLINDEEKMKLSGGKSTAPVVNLDVGAGTWVKEGVGVLAALPTTLVGAGLMTAGAIGTTIGTAMMFTGVGAIPGAAITGVSLAAGAYGSYLVGHAPGAYAEGRAAMGPEKNVGRQFEDAVKALEATHPELVGTFVPKTVAAPGDKIIRENSDGTVVVTTDEKLAIAQGVMDQKAMTLEEAKGAGGVPIDVKTAGRALVSQPGQGPVTLETMAQSWYKTSYGKLDKTQMSGFLLTIDKLNTLGFPLGTELLEKERQDLVTGQRSLDSIAAMTIFATEKANEAIAGAVSENLTASGGALEGMHGLDQRTMELLAREKEAETPEERLKYRNAARESYLMGAKKARKTPSARELVKVDEAFEAVLTSKEAPLSVVASNLKALDNAVKKTGERNILTGFALDVKDMEDKYRPQAREWISRVMGDKGYEALTPEALEKMDPGLKKAIGATSWGGAILAKEADIKSLGELKSKVADEKDTTSKEFQNKYTKMVENLDMDASVKQGLSKNVGAGKEELTRSITEAMDRVVTTLKSGEGNKQGISTAPRGSPDVSTLAQGTGQEQDSVQMNINVSVLTALESLNKHLRDLKGNK